MNHGGVVAMAVAASLALSGPATALSCVAPDPERSFDAALTSDDSFLVVSGAFAFDESALPRGRNGGQTPPVSLRARFTGTGLTFDGFTTPLSMPVTLRVSCLDPWCGSLSADVPHLAFLRRRIGGYVIDIAPCPQWIFQTPAPEVLQRMHECLVEDGCDTAP